MKGEKMTIVTGYLQAIDNYRRQPQADDVESFIKNLIQTYAEEHSTTDSGYASLINELGSYYRGSRRFDEGAQAFLEAADILEQMGDSMRCEREVTLNNLAELHRMEGRLDEAQAQLEASLEVFADAEDDQLIPYVSALNYLGHVKMDRNDYLEALELYERSRDLLEANDGPEPMIETAYQNLAGALARLAGKDAERANGTQPRTETK